MKDELFIRGDVPMTKEEVRAVSIEKLELRPGDILYDIGAGTGSVAIESALRYPQSQIYAVEKKQEGIDLILQNQKRFHAENVEVIKGEAPEVFKFLPVPTQAFLGGTGGKMEDILDQLINRNPLIRVVVNVIALESLSQLLLWLKNRGIEGEIVQLSVAKAKAINHYHMMMGQNPVYILSFGGRQHG